MKIEIDTRGVPATEDEATRMWCPFARVAFVGENVMNRISTFHMELARKQAERGDGRDLKHYEQKVADTRCLASRCMAWRWAGYRQRGANDEATGYCGLAGRPDELQSAQPSNLPAP